jgi:flagellar export protein FliJ
MTFHFALQAVLRYRKSTEERELLRLRELLARRAGLLQKLDAHRIWQLNLKQALLDALEGSAVSASEIQFCSIRIESSNRAVEQLHRGLKELQAELDKQVQRYEQERRNRKVLESLRDTQQHRYQVEQQRREQATLDESYLLHSAVKRA